MERETGFESVKITFLTYSTFYLIILYSPILPCNLGIYSLQSFLLSSNQFYPFYKNWWGIRWGTTNTPKSQVSICNSISYIMQLSGEL